MSKSIKLKNNTYWDSTGIVHNQEKLNTVLNNIQSKVDRQSYMKVTQINSTERVATPNQPVTFNLSGNRQNFDMVVAICRGDWNHIVPVIFIKGVNYSLLNTITAYNSDGYRCHGHIEFTSDTSMKLVCTQANGWSRSGL